MRFIKRDYCLKLGKTRERSKFLFFPMTIEDETRWLEWAKYTERVVETADVGGMLCLEWVIVSWAN